MLSAIPGPSRPAHETAPPPRPALARIGAPLACGLLAVALVGASAGCSSGSAPAFDLTAPRITRGGHINGTLVVTEPTSIDPLSNERIVAKDAAGSISYIGGAQWADRLPRLFQTRLIQTFENASNLKAVGRPGEGLVADYQLNADLREFQYDAARGEAVVEVSVKLLSTQTGKIVRAKIFRSRLPVTSSQGSYVAQMLDRALTNVLIEIVRWA